MHIGTENGQNLRPFLLLLQRMHTNRNVKDSNATQIMPHNIVHSSVMYEGGLKPEMLIG